MAEEGSESARQAPVFYEGDSPDGKYAGTNEKCRPRSPGEEIPGTARVDWIHGNFPPHKRSFTTAVSPVLLFWLAIQFFYSFDDQLVLCYNIENKNDKRKQWPRLDKSFHKMTRITSYKHAKIMAQEVESYELVRKY